MGWNWKICKERSWRVTSSQLRVNELIGLGIPRSPTTKAVPSGKTEKEWPHSWFLSSFTVTLHYPIPTISFPQLRYSSRLRLLCPARDNWPPWISQSVRIWSNYLSMYLHHQRVWIRKNSCFNKRPWVVSTVVPLIRGFRYLQLRSRCRWSPSSSWCTVRRTIVAECYVTKPTSLPSLQPVPQAFYLLAPSQERWGQYSKIFWERDHVTFITIRGYNSSLLVLVIIVNLLVCLIYKFNFLTGMYV